MRFLPPCFSFEDALRWTSGLALALYVVLISGFYRFVAKRIFSSTTFLFRRAWLDWWGYYFGFCVVNGMPTPQHRVRLVFIRAFLIVRSQLITYFVDIALWRGDYLLIGRTRSWRNRSMCSLGRGLINLFFFLTAISASLRPAALGIMLLYFVNVSSHARLILHFSIMLNWLFLMTLYQ